MVRLALTLVNAGSICETPGRVSSVISPWKPHTFLIHRPSLSAVLHSISHMLIWAPRWCPSLDGRCRFNTQASSQSTMR